MLLDLYSTTSGPAELASLFMPHEPVAIVTFKLVLDDGISAEVLRQLTIQTTFALACTHHGHKNTLDG
jgi:hypothetical protein